MPNKYTESPTTPVYCAISGGMSEKSFRKNKIQLFLGRFFSLHTLYDKSCVASCEVFQTNSKKLSILYFSLSLDSVKLTNKWNFWRNRKKNDNAKNAICAHNSCRNWAKRNEFSRLRREEISWEKKAGKKERKEFTPITKQKMILYHLLVLIHFRFSCLLLISPFFLSSFGLLIFFCYFFRCDVVEVHDVRFVRRYINMQLMAEKSRHNAINLFAQRNWTARIRKTSMCDVK